MDLGLIVVLLLLGSVIFDNRKKRRNSQNKNPNEDNADIENRTGFDWSEPGEQNRPGPRSQQPTNPMPSNESRNQP